MIEGNLAVKADAIPAAEPCEAAICQWPSGCWRGRFRLAAMPDGGRLWLCRGHAASVVKASTAVLATRTPRSKLRPSRTGARAARAERTAPSQAAPSPAPVRPAVKPEPARAPGVWSWAAAVWEEVSRAVWMLVFAPIIMAVGILALAPFLIAYAVVWGVVMYLIQGLVYLIQWAAGLL